MRERWLGDETALDVLALGRRLRDERALRRAGMGRGSAYRVDPTDRGDAIAWLDGAESAGVARLFAALDEIRRSAMRELCLGLDVVEVQIARFPPGARFLKHRDAFSDDPNGRRLTLTWYLNPAWSPGDGGEIVLYPEPGAEPVVIPPVLGRAVIFLSKSVEHEVRPTLTERWAVSAWFRPSDPLGL